MPAIYLITGIMAAGKSTVAEVLAKRLKKSVHLRGDIFRRMITSGREDMTADASSEALSQLNLRYNISANTAESYHNAGFDVVWQDVMVGHVLPKVISRISVRPLYLIVLCPSPEIVAQREAGRNKTGYSGGFTPENFDKLLHNETPPIGLWIDSSNMTAEQTADKILACTAKGQGLIAKPFVKNAKNDFAIL